MFALDMLIEFLKDKPLSMRIGTAMKEPWRIIGEECHEVWEVMDYGFIKIKTTMNAKLSPPQHGPSMCLALLEQITLS